MTNSKEKINWYYVLVGLFFLIGYFYPVKSKITDIELNTKTITLKQKLQFLKGGSRGNSFHRLWTNQTNAAFIIDVSGGIAAKWAPLDSLEKGDTLTIKYSSNKETELADKSQEIPIYFLQKADKIIFDTNDYNQSKSDYENRWSWIIAIISILLLLRGLKIINSKGTYILGAIFFLTILVLRLFGKF